MILWLPAAALPSRAVAGEAEAAGAEPGLDLLEVVRLTLENDPNIAIVEARLEASRGALTAARGDFDPLLSSSLTQSDSRTPVAGAAAADSSSLVHSVRLEQLLRTGLTLTPSVELRRTDDGGPAVNTATVSFSLRQPLLRDRGRAVVEAEVEASAREVEAGRLELAHAVAQRLAAVASSYWSARAAVLDLEVLRLTETRSRELLETTRRLVAADVVPAADVVQLEADLTSREVSRIAGERTLFRARQNLGFEIGLGSVEILALPMPSDPLPTVAPESVPPAPSRHLLAEALARRADLAAARNRLRAAEIRLRAADNALKPRLDLLWVPSYSGLTEGGGAGRFVSPLVDGVPGLSTSFGLSLSWPTANRRAEGFLVQAEAGVRQSALVVDLAANSIGAEVPAALDAVRRSAEQLARLDRAVSLFETTLDNEVKKLGAGSSTLVDVISQRDRLTSAEQRRIAAQLALALALVDLRFQTGTLYRGGPGAGTIGRENLEALPF